MKTRALVTLALAALAVVVLTAMPALAAKGGKDRPYKLSGTQTGTIAFSDGCFLDPQVDCTFDWEVVGPAIGSHLGRSSVGSESDGPDRDSSTYTADNGDKLYSTGIQGARPDIDCPAVSGYDYSDTSSSDLTFAGGTGRFADAVGKGVSVSCIYIDFNSFDGVGFPFYVTYSETGTLSY